MEDTNTINGMDEATIDNTIPFTMIYDEHCSGEPGVIKIVTKFNVMEGKKVVAVKGIGLCYNVGATLEDKKELFSEATCNDAIEKHVTVKFQAMVRPMLESGDIAAIKTVRDTWKPGVKLIQANINPMDVAKNLFGDMSVEDIKAFMAGIGKTL